MANFLLFINKRNPTIDISMIGKKLNGENESTESAPKRKGDKYLNIIGKDLTKAPQLNFQEN